MAIGTLSPTTWITGTVAPANWFQGVTDNVNGFLGGTATMKALTLDGTGGAAAAPATGSVYGTSAPTATVVAGTLYKQLIPIAWAKIAHSGGVATFSRGVNVSSILRNGTGQVAITLISGAANALIGVASVRDSNTGYAVVGADAFTNKVSVTTNNTAGAATDMDFYVIVFGG